jgi:plastocyanin
MLPILRAFDSPRRSLPALLGLVLLLGGSVLLGATLAPSAADPAVVVGMTNTMTYTPDTVRVEVGETVRWENSSAVMHTVTADPEEAFKDESVTLPDGASTFNSGNMDPGQTFEHTFETPGTYRYFCIPHEAVGMRGTVIVE